jgi:hypothetical protein
MLKHIVMGVALTTEPSRRESIDRNKILGDHKVRAAWIGFSGSVVAALITAGGATGWFGLSHTNTPHGAPTNTPQITVAANPARASTRPQAPHGFMNVKLSTVAPGKGGIAAPGTPQFPGGGLPSSLSSSSSFPYALSTFQIGFADCHCVPPIVPNYLTLAYMPKTTCRSMDLSILAPWGGGPIPAPGGVGPGSDEVYIIQPGRATVAARVDGNTPLVKLSAPLTGGPWELRVSELSPAANGNQATVFINGTLSCSTPSGI